MIRINVVGDTFCDVVANGVNSIPNWGEDTLSSGIISIAGGSGLNTTVHGATYSLWVNAKVEIGFFSSVGDDLFGKICMDRLNELELIRNCVLEKVGDRTGTCIVISNSIDRGFISDRGCLDRLNMQSFNEESLLNCNHFHIAGYYNCREIIKTCPPLLQRANELGITTSITPQFDALKKWDGIKEICTNLDVIICNEVELKGIVASSSTDVTNRQAAEQLLQLGCRMVVVTMASKGSCAYYFGNELNQTSNSLKVDIIEIYQEAIPVPVVVDPTGAGDAFAGGFLVDWVSNGKINVKKALVAGSMNASAAITQVGGSVANIYVLSTICNRMMAK